MCCSKETQIRDKSGQLTEQWSKGIVLLYLVTKELSVFSLKNCLARFRPTKSLSFCNSKKTREYFVKGKCRKFLRISWGDVQDSERISSFTGSNLSFIIISRREIHTTEISGSVTRVFENNHGRNFMTLAALTLDNAIVTLIFVERDRSWKIDSRKWKTFYTVSQ